MLGSKEEAKIAKALDVVKVYHNASPTMAAGKWTQVSGASSVSSISAIDTRAIPATRDQGKRLVLAC